MITSVDTNVLVDVLEADPTFGEVSRAALKRCLREGSIVACDVVWAEVATIYAGAGKPLLAALDSIDLGYSPMDKSATLVAARQWHRFRRGGGGRDRIVADFLIGGHAQEQCDRLLTRDRGFYRKCFKGLKLLDPTRDTK